MAIIEKEHMLFEVDLDATKEYYQVRTPIAGPAMRNFEEQVCEAAPLLKEYLEEFGVDLRKPDELCWYWKDAKNTIHYNVAYTVTGEIIKSAQHQTGKSLKTVQNEVILLDKSKIHLVLEDAYIPNEQTKGYFGFTAYNIEMPWVVDEEYSEMMSESSDDTGMFDAILDILKKLKKRWTN